MSTSTDSSTPIPTRGRPLDGAGAAEYLGTTERHVRRLTVERRIRHVRVGHFIRYLPRDLDAYLDAHAYEVQA